MSFQDIFKSSFLENVSSIYLLDIVLSLVLAFGLGMFIFLIYKKYSVQDLHKSEKHLLLFYINLTFG